MRSKTNQRFFHDLILPPIFTRWPLHIFSVRMTKGQVSMLWPDDSTWARSLSLWVVSSWSLLSASSRLLRSSSNICRRACTSLSWERRERRKGNRWREEKRGGNNRGKRESGRIFSHLSGVQAELPVETLVSMLSELSRLSVSYAWLPLGGAWWCRME
ncbi:hypothetical protein EYF80_017292 [Liparis tanakae]|uniref:Uncharacterized protein n=1 Tax=Liparis tanakae TaxID=230148 RepID=A0A4Z2I366_9TELE|nr:hypothetical protein EYF80_017292 [Liparis tanakae]